MNSDQADLNNNRQGDVCEAQRTKALSNTTTNENLITIAYDLDGDGIPDHEDLCPNIPGQIENRGCPSIPSNIDTCTTTDITPTCGNGIINEEETCINCPEDVGVCTSICGNGKVEPGEDCDDGTDNGKNGKCSTLCTLPFC
jgi:cysteine-rich repeat protein